MTFLLESLSRLVAVLIALISRDPALTPPTSHCPAVEAFLAQTSLEIRTKMCYSRKNLNKSKIFWSIWIHFYPFWSIHPILTMLLGRISDLMSERICCRKNVGPAVGLDLWYVVAERTVRPERPDRYTNLKIISKCSDSLQLQLLAHFRMTWMKSLLLLLLLSPLISTSAPYDPQERWTFCDRIITIVRNCPHITTLSSLCHSRCHGQGQS